MAFKDHFSSQSAAYRRYRPEYPAELIRYVASLAPDRRVAIDCATGNGQAAVALAEHFETVLAVDGSRSQLERAQAPSFKDHLLAMPQDDGAFERPDIVLRETKL